jgi:uncharacterized protein
MLTDFRVVNFLSFKDEQRFTLIASSDPTHQECVSQPADGVRVLKVSAVYGANASGKSNLIKAMKAAVSFIINSANQSNLGKPINIYRPFRLHQPTTRQPSMFEFSILIGGRRFEYGFSVDSERVYDEWLFVYTQPGAARPSKWLERYYDARTKKETWHFRGPLKPHERLLRERTRDNCLVLSRGADLNIEAFHALFLWFVQSVWFFDLSEKPTTLMSQTARRMHGDSSFAERVTKLIRDADTGIANLEPTVQEIKLDDLPIRLSADRQRSLNLEFEEGPTIQSWGVNSLRRTSDGKGLVQFDFEYEESNGTQRLLAIAGPCLDALDRGTTVVVDELECSLHPLLVHKIVELFQSPIANPRGAQLIFATHEDELMRPDLFRRDQIWLAEKNHEYSTELVSLYDFSDKERPRSQEMFRKNYLAGRYGGIPRFGRTFEELDTRGAPEETKA